MQISNNSWSKLLLIKTEFILYLFLGLPLYFLILQTPITCKLGYTILLDCHFAVSSSKKRSVDYSRYQVKSSIFPGTVAGLCQLPTNFKGRISSGEKPMTNFERSSLFPLTIAGLCRLPSTLRAKKYCQKHQRQTLKVFCCVFFPAQLQDFGLENLPGVL
jgi:hypothetical protein